MNSGILYIDKEVNFTSTDVDRCIKKKFNEKKVGHLGTLDPFATGLLVVALGESTKALSLFQDDIKEYVALLQLGESRDTEDRTGKTMERKEVPLFTEEQIKETLSSFLGISYQTPNPYSARHIDGRRAYEWAHDGIEKTLPPKEIEIKEIELLAYDMEKKTILFRVLVSKGTYIRALGRDIALRLGTVGYLETLRRTRVGDLKVEEAKRLNDVSVEDLKDISQALPYIRTYIAKDFVAYLAYHGQKLRLPFSDTYVIVRDEKEILGIYRKNQETGLYDCYRGMKDANPQDQLKK